VFLLKWKTIISYIRLISFYISEDFDKPISPFWNWPAVGAGLVQELGLIASNRIKIPKRIRQPTDQDTEWRTGRGLSKVFSLPVAHI